MLKSEDASQWQPNHEEQQFIEKLAQFYVAECRSSTLLRKIPGVAAMYHKAWTAFYEKPLKAPARNDLKGRKEYEEKFSKICFGEAGPQTPEDHIQIVFAAYGGVHCLMMYEFPQMAEMIRRAHLIASGEIGGQDTPKSKHACYHLSVDDRVVCEGEEEEYVIVGLGKNKTIGKYAEIQAGDGSIKTVPIETVGWA